MRLTLFPSILIILLTIGLTACSGLSPDKTVNWSAEQLLDAARASLTSGDFETAIDYYQKLEARFPYGKYAEQAQIDMAYAFYKNRQSELAVAAADRFIYLHPTHPRVDYAYYLKGLAAFQTEPGLIDRITRSEVLTTRDPRPAQEAFDAFRELITRYPDSQYAGDAQSRMEKILNIMAHHDLSIARYYLSRGAYVAVVNRTKYVIERYQNTPAVEDALGIMAIAYGEMGVEDLQQDTLRVLQLNFPDSDYL